MSKKMMRRRRHDRLKRLKRVRDHRAEDRAFFRKGTIPPSAVRVVICSCGARAFSRDGHDPFLDEFDAIHEYCTP